MTFSCVRDVLPKLQKVNANNINNQFYEYSRTITGGARVSSLADASSTGFSAVCSNRDRRRGLIVTDCSCLGNNEIRTKFSAAGALLVDGFFSCTVDDEDDDGGDNDG